jgi:hypothetical protein
MRQDSIRVAGAAGVLIGVNLFARLISRFVLDQDVDPLVPGLLSLLVMVLVAGLIAFGWTRRFRAGSVVGQLLLVVVITSLAVVLVGPLVSGDADYDLTVLLRQLALCAGLLLVGQAGGAFLAVALGLDPTSRAWRLQADRVIKDRTRPRRKSGARG